MPTSFRKLHGLGNDFIVFDGRRAGLPLDRIEARAADLCDRHRGVGADGVLLILPPRAGGDARMRVINADGSEPETCGNGIRCVARVLFEHGDALAGRGDLAIETRGGLTRCRIDPSGPEMTVQVEMGPARILSEMIERPLGDRYPGLSGTGVSVGNPHLVVFVEEDPAARVAQLGSSLEHHPSFPDRTNVELARCHEDRIELVVWERGVGLTQACGTGACATAAAAVTTKRRPADTPIAVDLPGGRLTIVVASDLSQVSMTGPAAEVFAGQLAL